MADRRTARERNAEVRMQQQKLSEERRRRSLRTEDFQFDEEPPAERVTFRSMASSDPLFAPTEEEIREQQAAHQEAVATHKKRVRKIRRDAWLSPLAETHETNFPMIASMILLCLLGVVMVTSSSYYFAYNNIGNPLYFMYRQIFYLVLGGAVLILATFIPLRMVKRLAWLAYGVSVASAAAVLFVGSSANGSMRWLAIGPIQFQPAELVKIGVALFIAVKVEQYQKTIESPKTFFKLLVLLLIPTGLVAYQNLTSGIIIAAIGLTIMLAGGCRIKHFIFVALFAGAILAVIIVLPIYVSVDKFPAFIQGFLYKFMYRSNRIKAFLDPFKYAQNEGYQTVQSLYAIGSGGFFGSGLGESIQKLGFIPEAYNDIIFAIICDELGLVGAGLVMILFGIIIWQGARITQQAPDLFSRFLAAGLVLQVGLQAVLNMAVSTNSLPATGVSLPFISYGGTSIMFLMASMGLLLNISRQTKGQEDG